MATGDTNIETTFSTDGKPHRNTISGADMTTIGTWEGSTLLLRSTLKVDGGDLSIEDRYTLGDGGQTLTLTRKLTSSEGATTATISMVKK
jgi:hypothetical protein